MGGRGAAGVLTHARKDRLYAAWLLFATTRMRRGEVCGLAWPELDPATVNALRERQYAQQEVILGDREG